MISVFTCASFTIFGDKSNAWSIAGGKTMGEFEGRVGSLSRPGHPSP